jgi:hypothetical protein
MSFSLLFNILSSADYPLLRNILLGQYRLLKSEANKLDFRSYEDFSFIREKSCVRRRRTVTLEVVFFSHILFLNGKRNISS